MDKKTRYAAILTVGLLACSAAGEMMSDTPHTSSVFSGISFLCFPAVLYVLLRRAARRRGALPFRRGLRLGEAVVRRAAFAMASVTSIVTFFQFSYVPPDGAFWVTFGSVKAAAFLFLATLALTWVAGVAFAALCAGIVGWQGRGGGGSPRSHALPAA